MIGKVVSHYQILEHLGGGGMGVVYKAQDLKLDRPVALKFLPPDLTRDPEAKQRFVHEAKAASTLQHTNICVVHDIDETPDGPAYPGAPTAGQMFICMEFLEGETLKKKIERGPLKINEAIAIAIQVAQGLTKAHEHGIVHRDIKPANIMLTTDGTAKIVDFGVAKLSGQTMLTRTGSTLGTVAYMSPEQARGELVDHRTDLWSLGVVIYEMLTGRRPFTAEFEQAMIYQIVNEPPAPIDMDSIAAPQGLIDVVLRCLEKKPADRYQSASAVVEDLARLRQGVSRSSRDSRGPDNRLVRAFSNRFTLAAFVFVLLVAAAYVLFKISSRTSVPEGSTTGGMWGASIAVLPFKDFSPAQDQEYFCDAMTDAVIDNLTRAGPLKVISLTSVMRYRNTQKDVRDIGVELGAANILEGSVQREADRIRVRVQLVQADNGYHLWAQTYDQDLHSVFEVQDQISRAIAGALNVAFKPSGSRTTSPGPKNLDAYEYHAKGMYFIKSKYVLTFREEDFLAAVAMLRHAIEADSTYAPSYFGLAWAYEFHYQVTGSPDDSRLMQDNCRKAWLLDPGSAVATATFGYGCYEYQHQRDTAFTYLKKALAMNPNIGDVNFLVGICYLYHGLYEEGIRYLSRAIELDPYFFWTPYKLAFCYMHSGEYEKAHAYFRKYFELAPIEPLVFPGQFVGLNIWTGNTATADSILTQARRRTPEAEWVKKYSAILLAQAGRSKEALALYRNSEVYALLGMNDEAIRQLNIEIRGTSLYPYIYFQDLLHNPNYGRLRGDPRFGEILQSEKALYERNVERYGSSAGSM
jgi:serine/threonine protein kinase/Tfp pilus assembly protein PilF